MKRIISILLLFCLSVFAVDITTVTIGTNARWPNAYAGMYAYDLSTGVTNHGTDQYHAVTTLVTGMVSGWTFVGGLTGTIASIAEGTVGDGKVTVTTGAAHGLTTGDIVCVEGSTDYNGKFIVESATPAGTTFVINATWTQTRTGFFERPCGLKAGIGAAGIYKIQYQLTVDSAGTNKEYKFELNQNITDEDKSACSRVVPGGAAWAPIGGLSLMTITAGDFIWISVKPISNTDNLVIKHGNCIATKL